MRGQGGQERSKAVVALAGLLAIVLLGAVGFASLSTSTANADTLLVSGADAVLVLADGTTSRAVVGEVVPRGATLQAGGTGAVLATLDRRVHLGQATTVTVVDGDSQILRDGFVFVDATEGPGVAMTTEAAAITTRDDSLVRVDAGPLLRVGVFAGPAASVRAEGRRAATDVPRYYQVQVAQAGLPGEPTPLLLTGDRYERDLARDLYDADRDLNALADRLGTAGQAGPVVLSVRTAALTGPETAAVAGMPVNDRALIFLIATALGGDDPLADRDARVAALRTAGGSWGVVAAIVETSPNDVSAVLGRLLLPVVPVLASAPLVLSGLTEPSTTPASAPSSGSATGTAGPSSNGSNGSAPVPGGASEPTAPSDSLPETMPLPDPDPLPDPMPSPPPSPPPSGVTPVDLVVDTVIGILTPEPEPEPTSPATPLVDLPVVKLDLTLLSSGTLGQVNLNLLGQQLLD